MNSLKSPKVSIIIPFYQPHAKYLDKCLRHCLDQDYPDYEILVISNQPLNITYPNLRVILTGKTSQGEKDDTGIAASSGEICAFLGDDSFPKRDWLKNAVKYFSDPSVGAVGGPGVTPDDDSLPAKASGFIYASILGGATTRFRYTPRELKHTDDLHGTNLLIRKSLLKEVGGFDVKFHSGEDTIICLKLVNKKWKILYVPDVIVYHHRRPLFVPHIKQVWNYGLHRGYFTKKFPETSRKFPYFVPSLFVIGLLVGSILSMFSPILKMIFLSVIAVYLLLCLLTGIMTKNLKMSALVFAGIPITHVCYGIAYLKGLMIRELKD